MMTANTHPSCCTVQPTPSVCTISCRPTGSRLMQFIAGYKGFVALLVAITVAGTYDVELAMRGIHNTLESLWKLSPYIVVAFSCAAYIKAAQIHHIIAKVFSGNTLLVIIAASAFGALSPLCSCTVIPVIAALLRGGVPLAAVMAFWIASPLMSPSMYMLTHGILGVEMALARLVGALLLGIGVGCATALFTRMGYFHAPLQELVYDTTEPMRHDMNPRWKFWEHAQRRKVFRREFLEVSIAILQWIALALFLETLMLEFTPTSLVQHWVGGTSLWAIPLATIVGIPAYMNGFASIPIIDGFMQSGMSPAAALAFMMGGAVTSIPAIMAVYPLVKRAVFLWYVGASLIGTACIAYLFHAYLTW